MRETISEDFFIIHFKLNLFSLMAFYKQRLKYSIKNSSKAVLCGRKEGLRFLKPSLYSPRQPQGWPSGGTCLPLGMRSEEYFLVT